MRVRTLPIYNGVWTNAYTSPLVTPELPRGMYDAIISLVAEQTLGAPTTATFTPSVQLWHPTTGQNWVETDGGSGPGLVSTNAWQTLTAAANPSLLPDGDFGSVDVKAATLSAPVYISKRVSGGFPWRLKLAWAFTGGTSPKTEFSVNIFIREANPAGFDRMESSA